MVRKRKPRKRKRRLRKTVVKVFLLLILLCSMIYLYNNIPGWLYPVEYGDTIVEEANDYDIDPLLVCSIIKCESNFDPEAESAVGAVGLMQIMPDTAAWVADKFAIEYEESMLLDPDYNIKLGCIYLYTLLDHFGGNMVEAVAAYNGGQGNVEKWISTGVWDGTEENIADIPFSETRTYAQKVMACYDNYINLYGDDIRFVGFR